MAKLYHTNRKYITAYAREIGYDYSRKPLLTDEQTKYIVSQYKETTIRQLSEMFNVSDSLVASIWMKNGLCGKENRVYHLNESILDDINSEEKAYFLGFFCSDGCMCRTSRKKQGTISFSLNKIDEPILIRFRKIFQTDKPISRVGNYVHFEISSDKLCDRIEELGVHPRKTIGNTFINLPQHLMRHFIRGYFDGDGTITRKKERMCDIGINISGYKTNMMKFEGFLREINIPSSFYIDVRERVSPETGEFGMLSLSNVTAKYCFLRYLYDDSSIFLQRKKDLAQSFINEITNENRSIHTITVNYYKYAVCNVAETL